MTTINIWPFRRTRQPDFDDLIRPYLQRMYRLAYRLTASLKKDDSIGQWNTRVSLRLDKLNYGSDDYQTIRGVYTENWIERRAGELM